MKPFWRDILWNTAAKIYCLVIYILSTYLQISNWHYKNDWNIVSISIENSKWKFYIVINAFDVYMNNICAQIDSHSELFDINTK